MATRPSMVSAVAAWCDCTRPMPVGKVTLADIEMDFRQRMRCRPPWTPALVEHYLVEIICEEERKKAAMPTVQVGMNIEVWGGDEVPRAKKKAPKGPRQATPSGTSKRPRDRQLRMFKVKR